MPDTFDFEAAKKALWGSDHVSAEHVLRIINIPATGDLNPTEREAVNFLMNSHGYTVDFNISRVSYPGEVNSLAQFKRGK
jgi:hypothetical protein